MNLQTFLEIMNLPTDLTVDEILERLIIYLRKSRKDMDYYKDESIEKTLQRHERELQEFITNIFGKPIPEHNIYREVVSGDTIEDRPVMQEVLSLIEDPYYIGVVCIEIERLARGNTMDQGIIAQTFQYTETKIITPLKIYNLDNEDDLSYFEDGLFQARKYLKYTKRILERGRIRSVKEGKYIGSDLPYGFNKIKLPDEKGYILVENESEANIVRLMADLFLNGLYTTYTVKNDDTVTTISKKFGTHKPNIVTTNLNLKVGMELKLTVDRQSVTYKIKENDTLEKIAAIYNIDKKKIHIQNDMFKPGEVLKIELNDMRCTNIAHYFNYLKITPRKSKIWSANMIRNILQSYPVYGYLTWNRRKTIKTLINGKIVKKCPNNKDFMLVKGRHEPILDVETGKKIAKKFRDNSVKTIPENDEIKNPLVDLLKCGYCGSNMTRRPYTQKKDAKPVIKRAYDIDKEKLRKILREHKGSTYSSEIARKLNVSKNTAAHWFANDIAHFSIPPADKWFELKKILNIKTAEFDKPITTFIEVINAPHQDTLLCNRPRCKCVGSDLELVEDRLLNALKILLNDYIRYVDNYEEEIKKETKRNNELLEILNKEIEKTKQQLEKACEFVETGAYTQDLFIKRSNVLNEKIENLINQKKELSKTTNRFETLNQRKKAIPILQEVLTTYNKDLKPSQRNELLKLVIKKGIYTKDKGGRYYKDNFKLKVELLSF